MKARCDMNGKDPLGLRILKKALWLIVLAIVLFTCYEQFIKSQMESKDLTRVKNFNYGGEKVFEKAYDFLPTNGTDYVELYVDNAKQAAHYYKTAFGFRDLEIV